VEKSRVECRRYLDGEASRIYGFEPSDAGSYSL
jgi:hypothetical protein